jgi:hypothetical protein
LGRRTEGQDLCVGFREVLFNVKNLLF